MVAPGKFLQDFLNCADYIFVNQSRNICMLTATYCTEIWSRKQKMVAGLRINWKERKLFEIIWRADKQKIYACSILLNKVGYAKRNAMFCLNAQATLLKT